MRKLLEAFALIFATLVIPGCQHAVATNPQHSKLGQPSWDIAGVGRDPRIQAHWWDSGRLVTLWKGEESAEGEAIKKLVVIGPTAGESRQISVPGSMRAISVSHGKAWAWVRPYVTDASIDKKTGSRVWTMDPQKQPQGRLWVCSLADGKWEESGTLDLSPGEALFQLCYLGGDAFLLKGVFHRGDLVGAYAHARLDVGGMKVGKIIPVEGPLGHLWCKFAGDPKYLFREMPGDYFHFCEPFLQSEAQILDCDVYSGAILRFDGLTGDPKGYLTVYSHPTVDAYRKVKTLQDRIVMGWAPLETGGVLIAAHEEGYSRVANVTPVDFNKPYRVRFREKKLHRAELARQYPGVVYWLMEPGSERPRPIPSPVGMASRLSPMDPIDVIRFNGLPGGIWEARGEICDDTSTAWWSLPQPSPNSTK